MANGTAQAKGEDEMSVGTKKRTQGERRDEAGRRLIEAGVSLVAERGLDRITLAEVGIAAGYSRGLTTHYFGSKQQFQEEVLDYIVTAFKDQFLFQHAQPGLSALIELLDICFSRPASDPISMDVLQVTLNSSDRSELMKVKFAPVRKQAWALYELHIREGIKSGAIRHDADPKIVTHLVLSALCGALRAPLSDRSVDRQSLGHELVEFILRGLKVPTEQGLIR